MLYSPYIEEIEVSKETPAFCFVMEKIWDGRMRENREAKINDRKCIVDSWDEAYEAIINFQEREVKYCRARLDLTLKTLDEIKSLKKPDGAV